MFIRKDKVETSNYSIEDYISTEICYLKGWNNSRIFISKW